MSEHKAWRKTVTQFFSEGDWRGLTGLVALTGYITLLALQIPRIETLGLLVGLVIGWYFGTRQTSPNPSEGEIWRRKRGTPPIGGGKGLRGVIEEIREKYAQSEAYPLKRGGKIGTIRAQLIDKLLVAINDAYTQAQAADPCLKAGAGTSMKEKYYRLLGYLGQVLDGIVKNVEVTEMNRRLLKVEEVLAEHGKVQTAA